MKKTLLISLTLLVGMVNCAEDKKAGRRARLDALKNSAQATEAELKENKRQNINDAAKAALKAGKIAEARKLIKKSLKLAPEDNATGYLMASQVLTEDKLKYLTEAASSSQSFEASESKAEALKQMKKTNSLAHIESVIKKYNAHVEAADKLRPEYKKIKHDLTKEPGNGAITHELRRLKAKQLELDQSFDAMIASERDRAGNKAGFDLLISDLINNKLDTNLNIYL